jgi:cell division protein FtsW (lipid II flippase)
MFDEFCTQLLDSVQSVIESNSFFTSGYGSMMQIMFPVLSFFILVGTVISLLTLPKNSEIWGKLVGVNDEKIYYIPHWENLIGRAANSDILIDKPTISKQHAAIIRNDSGEWKIYDLESSHGIYVNDEEVISDEVVKFGDKITLADYSVTLEPLTKAEKKKNERRRSRFRPIPPWCMLMLLTIFQFFASFSLILNLGDEATIYILPSFLLLTIMMWAYFLMLSLFGIKGFELEIIAFYLSTLSLSIVGSYAPSTINKQAYAIAIGIVFLICFQLFLRNLNRVQTFRWVMAGVTVALLIATIVFGSEKYGATNWITINGVSLQLSEIAKITYIFAGACTLDRMFKKRNIILFIVLTFASIAVLAYCSDFGTASIFFITFIVIAFLRSGSIATIVFICSGAVAGGMLVITAKKYIFARFSSWRHAWDYAASTGYQQVNTMVAINNGGYTGVGVGNGSLSSRHVAAADTDLVFGMLSEEWGFIIALFAIACILVLAIFAIKSCINSRSCFYTIAACAATSLLLFQTALNVFGAVDILPLTGVTFPFVSNGGSSMVMAWGVLAFLKATDTRPNASIATRLRKNEQAPTYETMRRKRGGFR